VQNTLAKYKIKKIILDPVMIATSGDKLLNQSAIDTLKKFIPHTYLITPNVPEAEVLLGDNISLGNLEDSARKLGEKYQVSVLLKGGHLELKELMTDTLYLHKSKKVIFIKNKSIETSNTHGTGCSLSSSIATFISLGDSLEEATIKGCNYLNQAIEAGKNKLLGKGHGPINHFSI